jgi:hypothetical protein
VGRRRGCSQRREKLIWGKSQLLGLWWMAGRGQSCAGFVIRGRNKGSTQFIEAGHGYPKFEGDLDRDGDKRLYW